MLLTPAACQPNFAVAFGARGVMALATFRCRHGCSPPGGPIFGETFSSIRAVNLIPLYLLVFPFFTLFDQTHSSWVEQAAKMDCTVLGYTLQPSQIQAVNPILILLFIPIFSYIIYPLLGRWFEFTPLRRIGIGLFLTAASFVIIALAQHSDAGKCILSGNPLAARSIAAEVMVSITASSSPTRKRPGK
jgi:POT family proton-dependent oligopeptide transporter